MLSSADLLDQTSERDEWLVDQRLPAIGTSLTIGARGVGKTALARDLSLAVARGDDWLGHPTQLGPVLFVSFSDEFELLRSEFGVAGLHSDDAIFFMNEVASGDSLSRIRDHAKSIDARLIVVDGLRALLNIETLRTQLGTPPLNRILKLASEAATHLMLVHDLEGNLADETRHLLQAAEPAIDTTLLITKANSRRRLRSIQRRGLSLLKPIALPERPSASSEDPAAEVCERVLKYLRDSKRLATREEISARLRHDGIGTRLVYRAISKLLGDGRLLQVGTGNVGDPHRFTGFDRTNHTGARWLSRVRPWAELPPRTRSRRSDESC